MSRIDGVLGRGFCVACRRKRIKRGDVCAAGIGSLFSGVLGLDLAVEAITGGRVAWVSETEPYAAAVAEARLGVPNVGDVRDLEEPPCPTDILCGGFPCQDISCAGKREGIEGDRSGLWSEYARLVRVVGPRLVFVENVAALAARGLGTVLGDLASCGFDAQWACLSAANVGATHRRNRLFLLAYRERSDLRVVAERFERVASERRDAQPLRAGEPVADAVQDGCEGLSEGHNDHWHHAPWGDADGRDQGVVFPPPPDDGEAWVRWVGSGRPQPGVLRSTYGPPRGVDARRRRARLACLGNAVIPTQAFVAFGRLAKRALSS